MMSDAVACLAFNGNLRFTKEEKGNNNEWQYDSLGSGRPKSTASGYVQLESQQYPSQLNCRTSYFNTSLWVGMLVDAEREGSTRLSPQPSIVLYTFQSKDII